MKREKGQVVLVILASILAVSVACAAGFVIIKLFEKERAAVEKELKCIDSTYYKKDCE